MKTTIDIPHSVYRQIKAKAALRGQTVRDFVLEALKDKLVSDRLTTVGCEGWRSVFGKASRADIAELQHTIDQEFSRIAPGDW